MSCSCHQTAGYCQCLVADSDCVRVQQTGPYKLEIIVDPDTDNLIERTPFGLQAILDRSQTNPRSTGVYNSDNEEIGVAAGPIQAIPFDVAVWDTHGGFQTAKSVRRVYFAQTGVFLVHANTMWPLQATPTTLRSGPKFSSGPWWLHSATRTAGGTESMFLNAGGIEAVFNQAVGGVLVEQYVELVVQSTLAAETLSEEASYRRASLSFTRLGGL